MLNSLEIFLIVCGSLIVLGGANELRKKYNKRQQENKSYRRYHRPEYYYDKNHTKKSRHGNTGRYHTTNKSYKKGTNTSEMTPEERRKYYLKKFEKNRNKTKDRKRRIYI